jgi:type IV pilus assembly protein PilC
MLFSPRISLRKLAELSRRLATSLGAGIDARTVWAREVERASHGERPQFAAISWAINHGESTAVALAETGAYFPDLFRDLAEVGELSGHQSEVFAQLADHYQGQLVMRRDFLASLTWPMIQFSLALLVVGFLIWAMGFISQMTGHRVDILGFGLVGTPGLLIYLAILTALGVAVGLLFAAIRRGRVWTRPLQRFVLRVPMLGSALETLALARLAWSMHLTLGAGMEIRRALSLSLRSTGNARYLDQITTVEAEIGRGNSIHEAFLRAGNYPVDFLDALSVGEESGRVVESMGLLSQQYTERARSAMAVLTTLAGFAVWAMVAAIIIALIFRLFGFYIGAIRDAAKM